MGYAKANKWFSVAYLLWTFLHFSLFLASDGEPYLSIDGFYPFDKNSDLDNYDSLELFVYLAFPVVIFIIIKLVGEDIKRFWSNE